MNANIPDPCETGCNRYIFKLVGDNAYIVTGVCTSTVVVVDGSQYARAGSRQPQRKPRPWFRQYERRSDKHEAKSAKLAAYGKR